MTTAHTTPGYDTALTPAAMRLQNRQMHATGGRSQENRSVGFVPAFRDLRSGRIYRSRFAGGIPAPVHVLDGLPAELVRQRDAHGHVLSVEAGIVPGFVRDGEFYTRAQAAAVCARPAGTGGGR